MLQSAKKLALPWKFIDAPPGTRAPWLRITALGQWGSSRFVRYW